MSNVSDLGLDLENLFQPAWAQGKTEANRFDKFTGNEGVKPERRRGGDRGERRGPRREGPGGGEPFGERRGSRPPRAGGKFGDRNRKEGSFRRDDRPEREEREAPEPLPDVGVTFQPDDKGVEFIARQIKMTGRAYPLFDIARLILQKPERYAVRLDVKKAVAQSSPAVQPEEAHGQEARAASAVAQPLFVCALDDTLWLSEDEAVAHVLKNHFATFYQADRTAIEPPKGKYTFVAQCGMSGVILGPPNYHDYQNQLRRLHAERFARMPFDVFKARVKIVKDEAVVKKWVEEQSFKTEYSCLNVPEPLKLPTMEDVEKHFRATHKEAIVKSVEKHIVDGVKSRNLRCSGLYRLIRTEWENQKYFPLQLSTELCRQFSGHGLQFFKVNKTVTHVGVARPLFLDLETTPVSDGIKRIVNFINSTPKCTRKKLVETLAPTPKPAASASEAPAPAAPAAEVQGGSTPTPTEPPAIPVAEPTPEQTLVLVDLHWLIHSGAVLEFADGRMETAKKPLPRLPKPEKKPAQEKPAAEPEAPPAIEPAPHSEATLPVEAAIEAAAEVAAPSEPSAETAVETQAPTEDVVETNTQADQPAANLSAQVETAAPAPEAASPGEVPSPS
jgi:hypothetical protein